MRMPRDEEARGLLSHLQEVLDDLYSFWERSRDLTVDETLLREFRWAIEEAYEELAQRFGNILGSSEGTPPDDEG